VNRLIQWFVETPVAANLLMVLILLGGTFSILGGLDKEVFPEIQVDTISIDVPYPGAGPKEVEQQIIIRIEEAIASLNGIDKITSVAREGQASVQVEAVSGYDVQRLVNEIKTRVDAISTFPENAERPQVQQNIRRNQIMSLALYGDVSESALKEAGELLRDELALLPQISQVELQATRPDELAIEVSEQALRRYNLSLGDVANAVRQHSVNMPAGTIKSPTGDMQVQTRGQAYYAEDFADIVVSSSREGAELKVVDVARVIDSFAEQDVIAHYNGQPAVFLDIYVSENPDILAATSAVREYLPTARSHLPATIALDISRDMSDVFVGRMNLLLKNAISGLSLVFIVLMLFLRPALSLWVCAGIATAFMGALWILPYADTTINMVSMFALILVLGIVVDDAIIVGESIYGAQQRGLHGNAAAAGGAKTVAKPVMFAVISTMIFFAPMLTLPGTMGDMSKPIPVVVLLCLAFSLIESLLILPSHLSHLKPEKPAKFFWSKKITAVRHTFSHGMERFARHHFKKLLSVALRNSAATVALFVVIFMLALTLYSSSWMRQSFMPIVPSDFLQLRIELPEGTAFSKTKAILERAETAAQALEDDPALQQANDGQEFIKNIQSWAWGNNIHAFLALQSAEEREVSVEAVSQRWRQLIGDIPEAETYDLAYTINTLGAAINLKLSIGEENTEKLAQAVREVEAALQDYPGVYDVKGSYQPARTEVELDLKPYASTLGITLADIARQVRQGFYGEEVQRIPRDNEDVRVMVRYPRSERESVDFLTDMRIRAPDGREVPISAVADIRFVPGYTTLEREERKRTYTITAELEKGEGNAGDIVADLFARNLTEWQARYPGFNLRVGGDMEEEAKFVDNVIKNFVLALVIIYGLMAVAFRSYSKPFLVLTAIPFGFVGAILGHLLLGLEVSMLSVLGFLACAGVVVNDNLVLLDRINQLRHQGLTEWQAALNGAQDRFRAIILTSLTTFVGLAPMMAEQSTQARFLIPMAVSLAFGVLFATAITLVLVPSLYYGGARLRVHALRRFNKPKPEQGEGAAE
jgi:multidrug efflux pump subunit AcrB